MDGRNSWRSFASIAVVVARRSIENLVSNLLIMGSTYGADEGCVQPSLG